MLRVLMFLVPIALMIYALVDCISTKDEDVKHLPKLVWLLLIVFAWLIGAIAWIFVGRQRGAAAVGNGGGQARGGRSGGGGWVAPDDNPDFLRSLNDEKQREENAKDKELLENWEEDLRRREEDLRKEDKNSDDGGPQDPPAK
ncbi:PLD nuclease N-terminal domain-containing protein [Streptomyces xiamenensis]|uniref:Membrane protein n=1 Tax=Streptomyces xiamenensis TaxID=408015 RepID=A0A0F7FV45_9ACTN|nr:PLD nuclease N-terminal domain-containing protein [Streptomyces xiamenensis]AKG44395.1 membrane protein [Streptomyces xiamenensis]